MTTRVPSQISSKDTIRRLTLFKSFGSVTVTAKSPRHVVPSNPIAQYRAFHTPETTMDEYDKIRALLPAQFFASTDEERRNMLEKIFENDKKEGIDIMLMMAASIEKAYCPTIKVAAAGEDMSSLRSTNQANAGSLLSSFADEIEVGGACVTTTSLVKDVLEDGLKVINNYGILNEIGRGRFGKVKLACDEDSNEFRAIKIIPKTLLKRQLLPCSDKSPAATDSVVFEVAVLKELKHRNIVKLYEVIDDPECDKLYLVMQYIEKGPVVKLDDDGRCPAVNLAVLRSYMRQLCSAVNYLHSKGIAHRDIKPDNILLGANGLVYLSDFGVSTIFGEQLSLFKASEGTPAFFAPEIFRESATFLDTGDQYCGSVDHQQSNSSSTSVATPTPPSPKGFLPKPADVWALGVTFYVMLFGRLPFTGDDFFSLRNSILNDSPSFDFGRVDTLDGVFSGDDEELSPLDNGVASQQELAVDLLEKMLCKDPDQRISIDACRKHKYILSKHRAILDVSNGCDSETTIEVDRDKQRAAISSVRRKTYFQTDPHSALLGVGEQVRSSAQLPTLPPSPKVSEVKEEVGPRSEKK